jgi:hypothetical protein
VQGKKSSQQCQITEISALLADFSAISFGTALEQIVFERDAEIKSSSRDTA